MYAESVGRLIDELRAFPGIGRKTAERMAFHILVSEAGVAERLASAITELKERVFPCSQCFNITDRDPCAICADEARDGAMLCVVEQPKDVLAIERMGLFKGRYHVLLGAISLLDGVREGDLTIGALVERVRAGPIREVILATSPSVDGDSTALAISRRLEKVPVKTPIKVSRLARGLPTGAALETASKAILADALEARRPFRDAD